MYEIDQLQENARLGWLLYLILGLLFVGVVAWWWISRRRLDQPEAPREAVIHREESGAADDLTRIEGIGPKVSRVLGEAGITTFKALANANASDVKRTLDAAGLQMMNPEGWIAQARLAANGEWAELEKLQAELKGGRRK